MTRNARTLVLSTGSVALMIAALGPQTATAVETAPEATVERRGVSPRERLRQAFSDLRPEQVPTGILLERGALGSAGLVRGHDGGGTAAAMTRWEFTNAYGDLARAALRSPLPDRRVLAEKARQWRERGGATPVSLVVLEYDTLADTERTRVAARPDGRLALPRGRLGDQRRYVAAAVQAEALYRWNPRLVVPSSLLVSNAGAAARLGDLRVRLAGFAPQAVRLDVPFVPLRLPRENGEHVLEVAFTLDGRPQLARAVVRVEGAAADAAPRDLPRATAALVPLAGARACTRGVIRVGGREVRYYDVAPVTASIPFTDPLDAPGEAARATINVRVYPAGDTVQELGGGQCAFRLAHPLVAVDGFDYSNTRTQESIWNDFGKGFLEFLQWGFDVVTVDYADGRDWIERNGYAVRELLARGLDDLVDPAVLARDEVVVVGGSMGSQTARFALRTAEIDGEDHNTGLFVAVDGPFRGANIPISLHAALDWGAEVFAGLDEFLDGLNSHAAVEQLRRTRYLDASGHTVWYRQHPRGVAYYARVSAAGFGLPRRCRNVAVASGSGTGSLQNDGSVQRLVYTDPSLWKNILGAQFGVKAWAKTDFAVSSPLYDLFPWLRPAVFYGIADDRILFNLIDLGIIPGGIRELRVALTAADSLDVAPGGYRKSPRDLLDAAAALGLEGKLRTDLDRHSFIPTFSALGVATGDSRYNPSADAQVASRVPFDSFFWEKCNRGHVEITDDAVGFVVRELAAFRDATEPPPPALYRTACGRPEPRELCLGLVTWLEDPAHPRDIVPWDDGANCYVTPVPAGRTGRVVGRSWYVEPVGGACGIGILETAGGRALCRLGTAPGETTPFVYSGSFYYDGPD